MMVATCVEGNGTETACVCVLKVLVDLTVQQISASVHQQVAKGGGSTGATRGCSPLQELEKGGLAPFPTKRTLPIQRQFSDLSTFQDLPLEISISQ